jgi:hypothetical protein
MYFSFFDVFMCFTMPYIMDMGNSQGDVRLHHIFPAQKDKMCILVVLDEMGGKIPGYEHHLV